MLADGDRLPVGVHLLGERAEQRVEREQVRHRLRVAEIVDGDDFEAGLALQVGAEEVAADPPEAVDRDARHRRASGHVQHAPLFLQPGEQIRERGANFSIPSASSVSTTSS